MPVFEAATTIARPLPEVFEFFLRPANLPRVSPPELHLQLVEGPERLAVGARVTLVGRRWGVPQRVTSEVTVLEENVCFQDEQREGPFKKFVHAHHFAEVPGGTRVADRIEFEPPGGLLGLLVTAAFIERDLRWIFAYRGQKLEELLGRVG
jgi:ligand-binding SRPBCC domain-containing protein